MVSNVFHENKCFITFIRFYWVFVYSYLSFFPDMTTVMLEGVVIHPQSRPELWFVIWENSHKVGPMNLENTLWTLSLVWLLEKLEIGIWAWLNFGCDSPKKTQHQSDHLPASVTASSALILATLRLQITVHSHSHLPHITGYFCYFGDNKSNLKRLQGAIVVTTHLFDNRDGTDRFVHSPSLSPVRKAAPKLVLRLYCQDYQHTCVLFDSTQS